jgi:hypothetical protein
MLYKFDLVVFGFELKGALPWSPDCPVVAPPLFPESAVFGVGLGGHRHPKGGALPPYVRCQGLNG